MRDDPRFLPYFDVPFQHASPRILAAMGRRPDPERNLALAGAHPRGAARRRCCARPSSSASPGRPTRTSRCCSTSRRRPPWTGSACFTYSREEDTPPARPARRVTKARGRARRKPPVERRRCRSRNSALDRQRRQDPRRADRGARPGRGAVARAGVPAGPRRGRPGRRAGAASRPGALVPRAHRSGATASTSRRSPVARARETNLPTSRR